MRKLKQLFTLSMLVVVCLSFTATLGESKMPSGTDFSHTMNECTIPSPIGGFVTNEFTDYAYGFNATANVTRVIGIGYLGVVNVNDTIEFNVIGNETTITYFNYTLPNINADDLMYTSFRVANGTESGLSFRNSTRIYTKNEGLNYTTFSVPFNTTLASIGQNATYYIQAYLEYARPFSTPEIYQNEQLLHYTELLYPLINNVPLIDGNTLLTIQSGGDRLIDDAVYAVQPTEYMISNASSGQLEWDDFTRDAFNYTQTYEDDLTIHAYLGSVSTTAEQGQSATAATVLFESVNAYRKVEVNPYGVVRITESQTLKYLGPDKPEDTPLTSYRAYALNAFQLVLEPNATVKSLTDELGFLNVRNRLDETGYYSPGTYKLDDSALYFGYKVLTVYPRYPVEHGEEIEFEVIYTVPIEQLLEREKGTTSYRLKLQPTSIFNWTIQELKLEVVLPRGAVYVASNYSSEDPYHTMSVSNRREFRLGSLGFKRILTFESTDLISADNTIFYISFQYTQFNLWIIFFLNAIGVAVIIGIYVGIRWFTQKTKEAAGTVEEEFIPLEEIEQFVKIYEDKLSIQARRNQTRAKIAAKKVKSREGKNQLEILEKRLRKVDEDLKDAKRDLIKHGGRYKEAVQDIEINERKLIEEQRNQRILQQEYRTKKSMTKEAYMKLFRDRQKNLEKLKSDIDGRLVGLRLLLDE